MISKHFIRTLVIGLSLVSINANGAILKVGEDSAFFKQGNRMGLKYLTFQTAPTRMFSDTDSTFSGAKKLLGKHKLLPLSLADYVNSGGGLKRFQTINSSTLSLDIADLNRPALVGDTVVPVPAAAWLFGSGLLGLVGMARRKARA